MESIQEGAQSFLCEWRKRSEEEWGGVALFSLHSLSLCMCLCVCVRGGWRGWSQEVMRESTLWLHSSTVYWTVTLMQTNKAKLWPQSHKNYNHVFFLYLKNLGTKILNKHNFLTICWKTIAQTINLFYCWQADTVAIFNAFNQEALKWILFWRRLKYFVKSKLTCDKGGPARSPL